MLGSWLVVVLLAMVLVCACASVRASGLRGWWHGLCAVVLVGVRCGRSLALCCVDGGGGVACSL